LRAPGAELPSACGFSAVQVICRNVHCEMLSSLAPSALSHGDGAPGAGAEDCITSARRLWRAELGSSPRPHLTRRRASPASLSGTKAQIQKIFLSKIAPVKTHEHDMMPRSARPRGPPQVALSLCRMTLLGRCRLRHLCGGASRANRAAFRA